VVVKSKLFSKPNLKKISERYRNMYMTFNWEFFSKKKL
jgi:hypothetical protein